MDASVWSGAAHEETGLLQNGTRSSLVTNPDSNLSNYDNSVRLWRPRGERLNPAFALQRHTAPTAGVMRLCDVPRLLRSKVKKSLVKRSEDTKFFSCQKIYSQFGLAIHQNDHQARRRFVEWAQNEIVVVPDFHKRILFSDEAHFWLNGYVNKQNCRIWSEANPQVYVQTPLHPEKLTVWCALWAGGILLQKR
ncbi:hypothetical protein TNCV_1872911 [Trichonephila clavipes]|nr:hypothetical protein TNCV_1872911 [Trichonephila clavipes]